MKTEINPKFSTLIDEVVSQYEHPVEIYEGMEYSQKETIKRIFFYSQSRYVDSQVDNEGRRKPFRNIVNEIVDDETTNTDPDLKNIQIKAVGYPERALLLRRYFLDWAKESAFSSVLNDINEIDVRYGGVITKRTESNGQLYIEPVQWTNVISDQVNIDDGIFIEKHSMSIGEIQRKKGVWDNIDEAIKLARKSTSSELSENSTIKQIDIFEIEGEIPLSYLKNESDVVEDAKDEYVRAHAFVATDGSEKVILFSEYGKPSIYKYHKRKKNARPGRSLGLGVVEEGFESQVATNEVAIAERLAFEIGSKIFAKTNSKSLSSSVLTDIPDGKIFQLDEGETFDPVILTPSMSMEYTNLMVKWEENYRKNSGVLSTSGEAKASVPFRSLALQTKLASGGSDYRKEGFNFFVTEIIYDWILPFIIKKISKESILEMEFTPTELQAFDDSFSKKEALNRANDAVKKMIIDGEPVNETTLDEKYQEIMSLIQSTKHRKLEIPKGYFNDIKKKITVLMDNEMEDKEAEMQTLYEMWSSMPPEDPNRQIIWNQMIELGGVVSPASMIKAGGTPQQSQPQVQREESTPSIVKSVSSLIPGSIK